MSTKKMAIDQLAGLSIRLKDGTLVVFVEESEDGGDEGTGGVREPARPKPGPPPTKAAATIS